MSLAAFAEFLIRPSGKTLLLATLALAGAQIAKFSAVLLYPFFFGILLIAVIAGKSTPNIPFLLTKKIRRPVIARFYGYLTSFVVMCVGSLLLVWAFYALHTLNFPPDKQIELIKVSMGHERAALVRELLTSMTQVPFLQPLAQYLLGVAMVFTRVAGGNTTFFLGEVTNQSFKWYFPVSYLIKEPLPLILMVILAAATAIRSTLAVKFRDYWRRFQTAVQGRVFELIMLAFIFFYGGISIMGNLNLGIRHLFPILPLISILASISAIKFFSGFRGAAGKKFAPVIFALLLAWYGLGTLATFPNYVSYFNEIVGGGKNGYRYMTDSNVDWGQDLKRFAIWLKTHPEIERIKLDYFGGGEPRYYFCDRTYDEQGSLIKNSSGYDCSNSIYQEWHANNGETIGWIAVSATFLQNSKYYKERFGEQDYAYLRSREPYARIGNSILVYWVR